MELVNLNFENVDSIISALEGEFKTEDLLIKYWDNDLNREQGIASTISYPEDNLKNLIFKAKRLVDRDGKSAVEIISIGEEEYVLYFYDASSEQIASL